MSKYDGYCSEGDRCVCGGDVPAVRAGCGSWNLTGESTRATTAPDLLHIPQEDRAAFKEFAVAHAKIAPFSNLRETMELWFLKCKAQLSPSTGGAPATDSAEREAVLRTAMNMLAGFYENAITPDEVKRVLTGLQAIASEPALDVSIPVRWERRMSDDKGQGPVSLYMKAEIEEWRATPRTAVPAVLAAPAAPPDVGESDG